MSRGLRTSLAALPLQKLLIEVFSIVLGVLLALAMNQWREARANRALAESALENVELEIRTNRDLLELVNKNNKSALAAANASVETGEEPVAFVPGLQLQEIAWTALLSTGVSSHVDYQTILTLSETYSIQQVYKELGVQVVQAELNSAAYAVATGATVDEQSKLEIFAGFFELLVSIEAELLRSFEATLVAMENTST